MEKFPNLHVISSRQDPPHTLYSIQGDNKKRVEYKYKEFENLREKIVEKWPGIFIPGIEPKKQKTKNETNITELRIAQLNRFCNKLGNIPYLFHSNEVSQFLNQNFHPTQESYEDIANKYKTAFSDFNDNFDENSEEVQSHLKSFFEKIKNIKSTTLELLAMVTDLKQREKKNKEMFMNTIEQLQIFEKDVLMSYVNNDCKQLVLFDMSNDALITSIVNFFKDETNPYDTFLIKLTEDLLDENAFLGAFDSLQNLKAILIKLKKAKQRSANNSNEKAINALKDIIRISTWHLDKETKKYNEQSIGNYSVEIEKMRHNFEYKNKMKDDILQAVLNDETIKNNV